MISTYQKLLAVCEWKFPGRFARSNAAWNGQENIQTYIDREWSWVPGQTPVTAAEIIGAETEYDAFVVGLPTARRENTAVNAINTPDNKTIRDALWELHEAIRGNLTLPAETKNQYTARLKDIRVSYEP